MKQTTAIDDVVPLPSFELDGYPEGAAGGASYLDYLSNYGSYMRDPQRSIVPYEGGGLVKNPVKKVFHRQVLVERIVEVPQVETQYVIKEVIVPHKYDVPIPHSKLVPVEKPVERHLPKPVDLSTTLKYVMPKLVPKYTTVKEKIIVPRYIEVAVPINVVEVNEFQSTLVPGPSMKDFEFPQSALAAAENGLFNVNVDTFLTEQES